MNSKAHAVKRRLQQGSIAVEAAIVLPVLIVFLTFPTLLWAMFFYQYSAAQKAVHDAAIYLSTAPKLEMSTAGPDGSPQALFVAREIFKMEMAGITDADLDIGCNYNAGGGTFTPKQCTVDNNNNYKMPLAQINVSIDMDFIDPITHGATGLRIQPYMLVSYPGG